ncbi:MAG: hypothetical protein IJ597_07045 [Synergistaceae bacterium]|nr:hypothetical protein [Synergistaceae bacterium]
MFGFKIKKVTTKRAYTIEALYAAIRDHEFSAGKPKLTEHGFANVITFPALDRNNQVWILPAQIKKECTKWYVQKQKRAGVKNMAIDMALDEISGGWSSFSGVFGKTAKRAEQLTEITAQELDSMDL